MCSKRNHQPPQSPAPTESYMYPVSGKKVSYPTYQQQSPPQGMDSSMCKDLVYSATENEYAYISEVPPYTTPSSTMSTRHMELNKLQRCDYGTHAHGQTPTINAVPSMRYVDTQTLSEPPTYFELDPEAHSARPQVGDNMAVSDNRGNQQGDLHYNQSVAEYPYDHLVDRNGINSNHKSV